MSQRRKLAAAEKIREAALEILRVTRQLPLSELKQRVEAEIGRPLRFEYFIGNFSGDRRFDFCNNSAVGLSICKTSIPNQAIVIEAWKKSILVRRSA